MTNIKFKCIYCEKETDYSDHLCNRCWELKTRIKDNFELAKKMIKEIENNVNTK
jgi:hypothetical protein